MTTIKQIIAKYDGQESEQRNGIDGAIMAAFWAGQEEMRGRIVRGMIARRDAHKPGRYHRRELAAMQEIMRDALLGGEGRDDSAEFLDWEFAL